MDHVKGNDALQLMASYIGNLIGTALADMSLVPQEGARFDV